MTYAIRRHNAHAFLDGLIRRHENHGAGHDLFYESRLRGSSLEDNFPRVIALRDNSRELARRNYEKGSYAFVSHFFDGLIDCLIRRDKPDFAALALQY